MAKREALGRGLDALMAPATGTPVQKTTPSKEVTVIGNIAEIDIQLIEANPNQPRTTFVEETLQELAQSIKSYGVIQPVTVRPLAGGKYQLISGERRLRASKMAEQKTIPAYVLMTTDADMLEKGLIENIQRENLNSIELALSYQAIMTGSALSMEEMADKIGKKRSTVNNYLRLLKLPSEIQADLRDGLIDMGHARALITLDNDEQKINTVRKIVKEGLSVRQVEELVRSLAQTADSTEKEKPVKLSLTDYQDQSVKAIAEKLGMKVQIKVNKKGEGDLQIHFNSDEDLARILNSIQ